MTDSITGPIEASIATASPMADPIAPPMADPTPLPPTPSPPLPTDVDTAALLSVSNARGEDEEHEIEWVPGDPIHPDPHITHQRYLYNFRDELAETGPAEEGDFAMSPDAAKWPTPGGNRALSPGDELGAFIRDYHEWRATQEPAPTSRGFLAVLGAELTRWARG